MRQQHRVRPDLDILVDDRVGPDVCRSLRWRTTGMHAPHVEMYAARIAERLMKKFKGAGRKRQIRIFGAQTWRAGMAGKSSPDDHGGSLGTAGRG